MEKSIAKNENKFYLYMLICSDNTFYIGSTNNIERRLHAHNNTKAGAHYTKIRRPVKLIYKEEYNTSSEAKKREASLKKLTRPEKEKLVQNICSITPIRT